MKTNESEAVNASIASVESSVVERIEILQRDIEDSNDQLQVTKQKIEEQQALLESRQLGLVNANTPDYDKSLLAATGKETSSAGTPFPLRNASLVQAQSTCQNASREALPRLNPERDTAASNAAGKRYG